MLALSNSVSTVAPTWLDMCPTNFHWCNQEQVWQGPCAPKCFTVKQRHILIEQMNNYSIKEVSKSYQFTKSGYAIGS